MKTSIPKAVPSSVAFSADNSVKINDTALRGPYQPATGHGIAPKVTRPEVQGEITPQPYFTGGNSAVKTMPQSGNPGAPSVPTDGFLFRSPPIDIHYVEGVETHNPYSKVNALHTVGWYTPVYPHQNHTAENQHTTETGFKVNGMQQRTSYWRVALPPIGNFGIQTFTPRPQPQAARYNRIRPSIGSVPYGTRDARRYTTGVLNRDTFGAGQTYGGQGGSNYTPAVGPPDTNPITAPGASPESSPEGWG